VCSGVQPSRKKENAVKRLNRFTAKKIPPNASALGGVYGIIASNKMFEAQLVEKAKWKKNVHKKSRCESPA